MFDFRLCFWLAVLLGLTVLAPPRGWGQSGASYDASWYDPDAPHLRIAVTSDGVYRVAAEALRNALPAGTQLSDIPPETVRLIENGQEIPIHVEGTGDGTLDPSDTITFVGQRNRGGDELWAYNGNPSAQSSTYRSLYSDTTHYWMTWGGEAGRRYERDSVPAGPLTTSVPDTVHVEEDEYYYFGQPGNSGNPIYTRSEGYYWTRFQHNDTAPLSETYSLPVGRRVESNTELDLTLRFDAETNSCHRVQVEGRLLQTDGSTAFESLQTVEWDGIERRTVEASVLQARIPTTGLELRLTSFNEGFSDEGCPDPSSTPNYVLFDWVEAAYTRVLTAQNDRQQFVVLASENGTYALTGHSSDSVHVYNPSDARRTTAATENDTARVALDSSPQPSPYWAVGTGGFRDPAAIQTDTPSNWSTPDAHGADYLILTTEALRPSAEQLADYRRSHDGYEVEVALVENVFDEFDYGRPTPVAIRRFVRATQDWAPAPRFLAIFGDAQYPIRDGSVDTLYPEWSVPSFGYAPSDGWFAMQTDGPEDWSEILAIGRIPVRSVAQGDLFLEKLQTYESAPLERWQKRMLLLAGGTSESEQESLQFYSNRWGEIASDTVASIDGEPTPVHTGMDTLRYYKNVTDPLDASFQDSLAVDLRRGAGWLNYFGHSAAQTWEIVTDPPSEFDNAGRLPIVISLGCRTGSFAGGRFEEKSAPSLGEQLVVGSVRPDGTPREGALNGGIAHFGESALGNLLPSARLNDALVRRTFVDTMRVLGSAIRAAKADIAADFGSSDLYAKHLLQYSLLGDPATDMALPARPDVHVSSELLSIDPTAPIPSDELTVTARVQNRGLIPSDSLTTRLTWERPDGTITQRTRRLDRFPLEKKVEFSFSLDERALGTNTFRVTVDPENAYAERNETDNTAERTQVVFDTGVALLSPAAYGTVSSTPPSLEFTISGQANEQVPVVLQLDTVPDFSSSFRREVERSVQDLRGTWRPASLQAGQTYYWRARLADADASTWRSAQFTVAPGQPEGSWLQQGRLFGANTSPRLLHAGSSWSFDEYGRTVLTHSERGQGSRVYGFIVDGTTRYEYLQFGFGVLVVDGTTGAVRASESFPTYDLRDDLEDEVGDQQEAINALSSFLEEVPEEGDYVFVRTRHLARESGPDIPNEVKALFQNLGPSNGAGEAYSTAIDTLTYQHVWALRAQVGSPSATVERVSPPSEAGQVNEILFESELNFSHASGRTISPLIGPASAWSTLSWTGTTSDSGDELELEVLSADSTVLVDDVTEPSGQRSLASIDAQAHPSLRLRARLTDSTSRTAPQLEQWSVAFEGVPELAVDPSGLQALPDTIEQGQAPSAIVPVVNFGPIASSPVRVHVSRTDASNTTTTLARDTLAALSPNGGRDTTTFTLSSTDSPGPNVITVDVDADGPPERITTNNTSVRNLFVRRDQTPPSVQVLANGRELPPTREDLNNLQAPELPFVSTQPTFEIVVEEDNPYLVLDDTSFVDVYLKGGLPQRDPGLGSAYRRIPYESDELELVPPDSGDAGPLRLLFEPTLSSRDSTYTLKVEAEDQRGNQIEPYQGSFRVQQEQVIRDVYPYPNPMRTHTTFAFRVEGGQNEMLRDFTLRIYTLSGRLIRQFNERDLTEPLRVGWNTLKWNGRDQDGDRVATGVYLYRVSVEGDDSTFHGDVEKVTVIR